MHRALAASLCCTIAACAFFPPQFPKVPEHATPEPPPKLEVRRTYYDAKATELEREEHVLAFPGGRTIPQGETLEWYPDGTLKARRSFERGEPVGTWTTWYASGAVDSVCTMGEDAEPAPMRWWHANGRLKCEGLGWNGIRSGPWKSWYSDGREESAGVYLGSERDGVWTFWNEDGGVRERCRYLRGVKVERFELGG